MTSLKKHYEIVPVIALGRARLPATWYGAASSDVGKVEGLRGDALRTIGLLVGMVGAGFLTLVLIAVHNIR